MDEEALLALISVVSFAIFCSVLLAFFTGINDYGNAVAASIASNFISRKTAKIGAVVFEVAGALVGVGLARERLTAGTLFPLGLDVVKFNESEIPILPMALLISSIFAACIWMVVSTSMGWSVSATHTVAVCFIVTTSIAGEASDIDWTVVFGYVIIWTIVPFGVYLVSFIGVKIHMNLFSNPARNDRFSRYLPYLIGFAMMPGLVTLLFFPLRSYWLSIVSEEWSSIIAQTGIAAFGVTVSSLTGFAVRKLLFGDGTTVSEMSKTSTTDEVEEKDSLEALSDSLRGAPGSQLKHRKKRSENIDKETAQKEKELRWSRQNEHDDEMSESGSVAISTVGLTQNVDDIAVDTISWGNDSDGTTESSACSSSEEKNGSESQENRISIDMVYNGLLYITMFSSLIVHGLSVSALLSVPLSWFLRTYMRASGGVMSIDSSLMLATVFVAVGLGLGIYMEDTIIVTKLSRLVVPHSPRSSWVGQSVSNWIQLGCLVVFGSYFRSIPISATIIIIVGLLGAKQSEGVEKEKEKEKEERIGGTKGLWRPYAATLPSCIFLSICCWFVFAWLYKDTFTYVVTSIEDL